MPTLKYKILKAIKDNSTPYAKITKLQPIFDIDDDNFIAVFTELERERLIASTNTSGCGLTVGACGTPAWSVVDLYVTKAGDLLLNPPKSKIFPVLIKFAEHPIISGLIVAFVCFVVALGYSSLDNVQQEKKEIPAGTQKLPKESQS